MGDDRYEAYRSMNPRYAKKKKDKAKKYVAFARKLVADTSQPEQGIGWYWDNVMEQFLDINVAKNYILHHLGVELETEFVVDENSVNKVFSFSVSNKEIYQALVPNYEEYGIEVPEGNTDYYGGIFDETLPKMDDYEKIKKETHEHCAMCLDCLVERFFTK